MSDDALNFDAPGGTIAAILYPGELGAAFGQLLLRRGVQVVTTCAGRSDRTGTLAQSSGIRVLHSLDDVICECDILFSVVSTSAAMETADAFCSLASLSKPSMLYVDLNSIGPETACGIAKKISATGRGFVDGAINGLAKNIATGGTLYLSGPRADEITRLVADGMRVRVLGNEPGQASAMKMLLGGLSKGVCTLYLELAALAQQRNMLPQFQDACDLIYRDIAALANRMLPTYAQHSQRRATEMQELEQTMAASQLTPCVVEAIRQMHERLADAKFEPSDSKDVASLVRRALAEELWDKK